jgi:hypothetical protein
VKADAAKSTASDAKKNVFMSVEPRLLLLCLLNHHLLTGGL